MTTCGYHNLMKLPVTWQNLGEAEVAFKGKESIILEKDKADGISCFSPDFFQRYTSRFSVKSVL